MRYVLHATAFLAFGTVTVAQPLQQPPYERILLPVSISEPLQGAFGSVWVTEITAHNGSDEAVVVTSAPDGLCGACPVMPPQRTFRLGLSVPNPNNGTFVYVGSPGAGKVTFTLRAQDTSRQAQTWGTEIPVVREKDVRTTRIQLLDIPVDVRFRATLRIYDFDSFADAPPRQVRLRIYDMCGIGPLDGPCSNTPLVDSQVALNNAGHVNPVYPEHPATNIIVNLVDAFPQLASVQGTQLAGGTRPASVRIDLDPITSGLRFWAFVSVTNNDTQHVTAITPD